MHAPDKHREAFNESARVHLQQDKTKNLRGGKTLEYKTEIKRRKPVLLVVLHVISMVHISELHDIRKT